MMINVCYNTLFDFVLYSQDEQDFIDRTSIASIVILHELGERLDGVFYPIQLLSVVDELNEEVNEVVYRLNRSKIVSNQPKMMKDVVIRLIENTNEKIYKDYYYAKNVLPN